MPLHFTSLEDLMRHGHDALIDVRSPAEFAEDHLPGAINLPVLSNAERAEVGTIYVQQSQFLARKIGAAKVFSNAASHLQGALKDKPGGWRPLVYCWRGGQRSGAFSWMLSQIGWRAETIVGGYQTYRRLVNAMLHKTPLPHRLVLLDGDTGTAKTDLLHLLAERGLQTLDLEACARHRGSLLGALNVPQPSQKAFESRIATRLLSMDPLRPVLVEAESSKIGARMIPPSLWALMKHAPRIELSAPLAARAAYLVHAYDDILSDTRTLHEKLDQLRPRRGHKMVEDWRALSVAGDKIALTSALMSQHYDPAYQKARSQTATEPVARIWLDTLDSKALGEAAAGIEKAMDQPDFSKS